MTGLSIGGGAGTPEFNNTKSHQQSPTKVSLLNSDPMRSSQAVGGGYGGMPSNGGAHKPNEFMMKRRLMRQNLE
jgi:hypothetical protein